MYGPSHLYRSRFQHFEESNKRHDRRSLADKDEDSRSSQELTTSSDPRGHTFLYPTMRRGLSSGTQQHSFESAFLEQEPAKSSHRYPFYKQCPILPPPPPPRTPLYRASYNISMGTSTPASAPRPVLLSPPPIRRVASSSYVRYERVGDSALRIFKLGLPRHLVGELDDIITMSEAYAQRSNNGWKTELYSLTKQDLALRDIPGMMSRMQPIFNYIAHAIQFLYGGAVLVDKNQPHILKYSVDSGHTGVQLHHDRCDVTANLVLSKSDEYEGGGTLIPDAGNRVIRLEQGEFLLHPGSLVHGGVDISKGARFLMVLFAHLK